MVLARLAVTCFCIVIVSTDAAGQHRREPSWRHLESRSTSDGRDVVVDTFEVRGVEGRWAPIQEIVTETIRTPPNTMQTRRDVFVFSRDGRTRLLETTESLWETLASGDTSAVHNTWAPDLDGRLELTAQQIERTRSAEPDVRETDATRFAPDVNGTLRETERTEYTVSLIGPGVVRHDITHFLRDVNGRWRPIETRRADVREIGPSEQLEEETIHRPDTSGKLAVAERNVIRRSTANEQDRVVVETYAPYADGFRRSESRLALRQRVHVTTTATADGGRHTVEEVEARSRVAPGDPMRVVRRTVTAVRQVETDGWVTERQVFERDVNGHLGLVSNDAARDPLPARP